MDLDEYFLYEHLYSNNNTRKFTNEKKKSTWYLIGIIFFLYFCCLFLVLFSKSFFFKKLKKNISIFFKTKSTNNYNKHDLCSICLDNFGNMNIIELYCNHKFHKNCIYKWFHIDIRCPLCRNT